MCGTQYPLWAAEGDSRSRCECLVAREAGGLAAEPLRASRGRGVSDNVQKCFIAAWELEVPDQRLKRNKLAGAHHPGCAEAMPCRSTDLAGPNGLVLTW